MLDVYGSDISTFVGAAPGIDPLFAEIRGERVVLERCARRLMTPYGSLPGAPEFGFDLIDLCGKRIESLTAKSRIKSRIEQQLLLDEAVSEAKVARFDRTGAFAWELEIRVRLTTGPFNLVLSVNEVTVAILRADRG